MEKITLMETIEPFDAIEDVATLVGQKLNTNAEEVLIRALSAYIGVEKPFANGEINAALQQHLASYLKEI